MVQNNVPKRQTLDWCKDSNAELENAENCCVEVCAFIWKVGLDAAENEPRKDAEKYTIYKSTLVIENLGKTNGPDIAMKTRRINLQLRMSRMS